VTEGPTGILSAPAWGLLVYIGLFPTVLAYILLLYGIRHTTATAATIITLLEAAVATFLAWTLFGEQLRPLGLVGALLLFAAIGLLPRGGSPRAARTADDRVRHPSADVEN